MIKTRLKKIWYVCGRIVTVIVFHILFRMHVHGSKNVPNSGPVLLLSNHQSFLDPMFCQTPVRRNLTFVARESLFTVRLLGTLLYSFGVIPIKRDRADVASMKVIMEKLRLGLAVCLFPEGTRTADGRIAEIKPGFGLISRRTGAVVVPMVIDGAFECWPRHRRFLRPGRVAVAYGEPITPERIKELGDREFAKVLTAQMRQMQSECRIRLGKEPFDYTKDHEEK